MGKDDKSNVTDKSETPVSSVKTHIRPLLHIAGFNPRIATVQWPRSTSVQPAASGAVLNACKRPIPSPTGTLRPMTGPANISHLGTKPAICNSGLSQLFIVQVTQKWYKNNQKSKWIIYMNSLVNAQGM